MSDEGKYVFDLDRKHVFHSWSAQATLNPFVVEKTAGSYVWDFDGKKYLDISSQLVNTNIGHQHPKVIAAIKDELSMSDAGATTYFYNAKKLAK